MSAHKSLFRRAWITFSSHLLQQCFYNSFLTVCNIFLPFFSVEDELSCSENGQVYSNKDIWKPEPCKICVCDSGTILCDEVQCNEVSYCEKVVIPDGECCPVCQSGEPEAGNTRPGKNSHREILLDQNKITITLTMYTVHTLITAILSILYFQVEELSG